jgi:hypothetical protein
MPQLGNFISSVTRQRYFNSVVDNVFDGIPLFQRLRGKARPWSGGVRLNIPTEVGTRTAGGSFSGFDTLSTNQEDVRQNFVVDPCEYYWAVSISGIQKALNKGPEAFVDVLTAEFQGAARALRNTMAEDLVLDGSGNNSKAVNGLQYHVDDATSTVTYQGLSRNTYTNLRATRTAQSGAFSFTNFDTDFDACQIGTDVPTLGITTPAVWSIMSRVVTPTYNIEMGQGYPMGNAAGTQGGVRLSAGPTSLVYRGVPIISDDQMTSGNFYLLNENHLWLYEIDGDPLLVDATKEGFSWSGWKKSINQNAITGHFLWAGQLVGDSPRTMSRRTGITS